MFSRRVLLTSFALATTLGIGGSATGQVYPSRPITMVVPFPAGGPLDAVGRIVAEGMRTSLGQPIIIENVAGASGSIGVGRVVRAAPDGHTIGIGGWPTHVVNGAIYPLQYDLLKDLAPVALISAQPMLIVAKGAMPAHDLKELIAWLKAHPDKASAAIAGGASHIGSVHFQNVSGTRFQLVPYRGAGPAMKDLVAGHIDMMIDLAANSLPQVRTGTIKAYAVTARSRLAPAPDVPTVDEAGLAGFYISSWFALWVPARTPNQAIGKLNAAVVSSLGDPAVRQRLAELGQEIPAREQQTSEALGAFHKAEIEKWWPVIKAANIKAE